MKKSEEIRNLINQGLSDDEIANRLGVKKTYVAVVRFRMKQKQKQAQIPQQPQPQEQQETPQPQEIKEKEPEIQVESETEEVKELKPEEIKQLVEQQPEEKTEETEETEETQTEEKEQVEQKPRAEISDQQASGIFKSLNYYFEIFDMDKLNDDEVELLGVAWKPVLEEKLGGSGNANMILAVAITVIIIGGRMALKIIEKLKKPEEKEKKEGGEMYK